MPNYIVHLYHHAQRHGESNTMPFPCLFLRQVRHSRNNLFDIRPGDTPALPKPNVLQSTCHIVLIPNTFQSTRCKYLIPCRACNTRLPYIHTPPIPICFIIANPRPKHNAAARHRAAAFRSFDQCLSPFCRFNSASSAFISAISTFSFSSHSSRVCAYTFRACFLPSIHVGE